jgi:hypothetical protein
MFRHNRSVLAAGCLAALVSIPCAGVSQTPAGAIPTVPTAELGIALPAVGGGHWFIVRKKYFSPAVMSDIRDNLHATYVRTGWIPDGLRFEDIRWRREDQGLDAICGSGLQAMILVPSPKDDDKGEDDLIKNIGEFFSRYAVREFGCLRFAEIVNEADLPANGFSDVKEYASFYERVAPTIAAFGIEVITSGTSGKDRPWTAALASVLRSADPSPPVSGYGFHPYGVPPAGMRGAMQEMRVAAGAGMHGPNPNVYVTEIGQKNADDLYQTIVNLAHATPTITIYEYMAQPNEEPVYGLKDNPALYEAVRKAWASITAQSGISSSSSPK